MTLQLEIITPYGEMFNGKALSVYLPSRDGEMGILPGHCDLLFFISTGVIEINLENKQRELVAVNWGYGSVSMNAVSIIADGAVAVGNSESGIVANKIEEAKAFLEGATSDTITVTSSLKKLKNGII